MRGNAMTMAHGARGYLVKGCPTKLDATAYAERLPMLNKHWNFTIDLSTSGCGCNAAVYATLMPAYNSQNQPDMTRSQDRCVCRRGVIVQVWRDASTSF